jgi:hypothetical protein
MELVMHNPRTNEPGANRQRERRFFVMAGLVPAIHVFGTAIRKTWMPGTRPGMTDK